MNYLFFLLILFLYGCTTQPPPLNERKIVYEENLKAQEQIESLNKQKLKDTNNNILTRKAWFNPELCQSVKIFKGWAPSHPAFGSKELLVEGNKYVEIRFVALDISASRDTDRWIMINVMDAKGNIGFFSKNILDDTISIVIPPGQPLDCFFTSNPREYLEELKTCNNKCSQLKKQEAIEYNNKIKNYTFINKNNLDKRVRTSIKAPARNIIPKAKVQSSQSYSSSCPCSGSSNCIGPRGGRYCITSGGNKRYR